LRKVSFILICIVAFVQCSVLKKGNYRNIESSGVLSEKSILESTKKKNITQDNFTVTKADIKIITNGGSENVIGSIKFENPDKYLISLKSRIGIEVTRIYISNDTILVNDRLNKKLYYGSPEYLERKYGLPISVLPLLFGDYIEDSETFEHSYKCEAGKLSRFGTLDSLRVQYIIDCKKEKSIMAKLEGISLITNISFKYGRFFYEGSRFLPGEIKITDFKNSITLEIRIKKIEASSKGNIKFIPGRNYEIIRLI
jgi:hypothetical protein